MDALFFVYCITMVKLQKAQYEVFQEVPFAFSVF